MLRNLMHTTTALAIAIAPLGAPLATTAAVGGALLVSTNAHSQDARAVKQRLDAARRAYQQARKTGEGVEAASQELNAARAAMAEAIGSQGGERAEGRRKPGNDKRRSPAETASETPPEQPPAVEEPVREASPEPVQKPDRQRAEGKPKPSGDAAERPTQPPAAKTTETPAEQPVTPSATADENRRPPPRKKAGERDRGETERRAGQPEAPPVQPDVARPRPKRGAPVARPLAEAPVERQIEEAGKKPVAVVPDSITDDQRNRLREAERRRRADARRNRETLIGAAAAGIAVGVVVPALGGKVVEDEGDRFVVERGGNYYVRKDESALFRNDSRNVEVERMRNGNTRETITRRNGSRIVTVRDPGGYILRRIKVSPDGERIVLYDARSEHSQPVVDYDRRLPPIRVKIPYDQYVVESGRYGRRELAQVWIAPPVEPVTYGYSLRDVRENERVRAMVRRVDLDTVTFDSGSATVRASQVPWLSDIAGGMLDVIYSEPRALFLVEGHTDAVGSEIYNLMLSDRRAETVARILVEAYDVPPENLVVQGYGEQYLKISTPYDEWRNRRVTIRNITPLVGGAG